MRALRASLSKSEPAYHGEFYDFEGMVVDPCAVPGNRIEPEHRASSCECFELVPGALPHQARAVVEADTDRHLGRECPQYGPGVVRIEFDDPDLA